jgi:hypothetical protein
VIFAKLVFAVHLTVLAQTAKDYCIPAWAEVGEHLTLRLSQSYAQPIVVHRRLHEQSGWGDTFAIWPANTVVYTDFSVSEGQCYEYRLSQNRGTYTAYGFVSGAMRKAPEIYAGTVLLVLDSTLFPALEYEIARWETDLQGEGWKTLRLRVGRNESPVSVKQKIVDVYSAHPDLSTLALFGRVPVPYSGEIVPDGHTLDHWGAWPADGFYGSLYGTWTDATVHRTTAARPENHNVPGDGKFDQWSFAPHGVNLAVGRVDMHDMPAFGLSEIELLRRYLNKNHTFRTGGLAIQNRGLVDDNFGTAAMNGDSPFSSTAFRNFPNFFKEPAWETDYLSAVSSGPYLWAYGCGAGSYTSCSGVAATSNFINQSAPAVFNAMIGSYFGDWDTHNNLLRAPLAAPGWGLANMWAGRPYYPLNEMAVGATLGKVVQKTMNATSQDYPMGYGETMVHIALMGDPTLRLHPQIPTPAPQLNHSSPTSITLDWPAHSAYGYKIYRFHPNEKRFTLVGESSGATSWTDERPLPGQNRYLIRSLFLHQNTYWGLTGGEQAAMTANVVYPGDVDEDGVVSIADFYLTAAAYGKSGPPRSDLGTIWRPYVAPDNWNDFINYQGNSINASRADADGDGTVTLYDLATAILLRGRRLP